MRTTTSNTLVGVFDNSAQAQQAISELKRAGFFENQIGMSSQASSAERPSETGGGGFFASLLDALGLSSGADAGDESRYYEDEWKAGRIFVTITPEGRYDDALAILRRLGARIAPARQTTTSQTEEDTRTVELREEELRARKQAVETGEVRVGKEVHTEHKTIDVPVTKEEVVVERRPVGEGRTSDAPIREGEEIRIPVREEEVLVEKQPVVKEEVEVSKRKVPGTERVSGEVRKEDIQVETEGNPKIDRERP